MNTGRTVSGSVSCGVFGNQVANYSSGISGTLNDGVDTGANEGSTHLFTTRLADDSEPIVPVITLYLGAMVSVQAIRIFGGTLFNAIPGALDGVTVEIEGTAVAVTTTPVGALNAIGVPVDDLIDLTGTPLAGVLTDRIVLRDFTSSFFGFPFDQFSISEITVDSAPTVTLISIDIKPGTYPNSINVGKKGRIAVGILSNSTFDAVNAVDQSSLTFGRTGNEGSFIQCGIEDANKDKRLDLVCHFDARSTGFQIGDTQGVLHGTTVQGLQIVGTDSVNIVR